MTDYRKAKCIELHDSNITLTTTEESYAHTAPIGRTEEPNKPAFSIKLHDIAMIAEMFNVNTTSTIKVPNLSNQPLASKENERIDYLELPIFRNHYDASDDPANVEDITKIECQLISDRNVNIKITTENNETSELYTEEITYSGTFTIWWAKDSSS